MAETDRAQALGALSADQDVSRETLERLDWFVDQALRWSARINLFARGDAPKIWTRHVLDSAGALTVARTLGLGSGAWLDLGSGGGFPALVVSILSGDAYRITMVESDGRKAAFLRHVVGSLGLNADVRVERSEAAPCLSPRIVSARAFAPLPRLLALAAPQASADPVFLLLKGADAAAEVAEARRLWRFEPTLTPHPYSEQGTIVVLRHVAPQAL